MSRNQYGTKPEARFAKVLRLAGLISMLAALLCTAQAKGNEMVASPGANKTNSTIFRSKAEQTSLLELYTSQGCYSCPTAENWLNTLLSFKGLWHDVVPIALHVDYWDYLGWKDPYGEKQNQERHYAYKFQGHTPAIYTPEMILNGRDYTTWRKGELPNFKTGKDIGELELSRTNDGIRVFFSSKNKSGKALRANVALLGFGITAAIKAGENDGRTLHHEFVSLARKSAIAYPVGPLYLWQFPAISSEHTRRRSALIAWLDSEDNNQPIQAVGGWID